MYFIRCLVVVCLKVLNLDVQGSLKNCRSGLVSFLTPFKRMGLIGRCLFTAFR